jgi:hypothetical protein
VDGLEVAQGFAGVAAERGFLDGQERVEQFRERAAEVREGEKN